MRYFAIQPKVQVHSTDKTCMTVLIVIVSVVVLNVSISKSNKAKKGATEIAQTEPSSATNTVAKEASIQTIATSDF